ncbi:SIR2 family protein [Bradyrhizobium forestalis]|uniref:SIR2 family protein n=1 Tax=Bradyrhizobium forestalis TaxID=1419263 RepID=UPI00130411B8|nr:SIR2 family protein [Bradyrhizobium forestalis]
MSQCELRLSNLDGAVVFVGSMLSADQDTGLPNGLRIGDAVLEKILEKLDALPAKFHITDERIKTIRTFARDTPFEQLFNSYPFDADAREIFADTFRRGKPNKFHAALADAVDKKKIAAIVTTNYDTCLEQSLRAFDLVIEQEHITKAPTSTNAVCLFKLHGCASLPSSIIYRLKDEGALPTWKREYLAALVRGRDVALLGYSGRDFDICPILLNSEYKSLTWLFPGTDLGQQLKSQSQNAQHVFGNLDRFPRVRAALGGFDAFFDMRDAFHPTKDSGEIVSRLFEKERQHPEEFAHWRASLLNAISCRIGTDAILGTLDVRTQSEPRFIRLRSDSLERSGCYRDSISEVVRWRNALDRTKQPDDWLETFVVEAGRCYTAGYLGGAARAFAAFRREITSLERDSIVFDESLAISHETYLYLLMRKRIPAAFPPLGKFLYPVLTHTLDIPRLQKAADFLYSRGRWQELHLIHQAASDFGVRLDIGAGSDRHVLLSAMDGFSQLNNLVGQAAAYRKSPVWDPDHCARLLDGLWAYGHNPEYWKCFVAFRRSLPVDVVDKARDRCAHAFAQCQYSALLTLVSRIRLRVGTRKSR